jgi:hypothetical protein
LSPTEKVIDLPVEEQVKEIRILPQKTSKPNIEEASHNTILNQPTLSANPLVVAPSLTRTGAKVVQVIGDIVPDRTVLSVDTTDELYLRIGVYFKKAGCKFYFDPKDFEIDPTKKRYKILRNLRERLQKQTENDRDRINEIFDEFWKEYGYTII